jgi:DNA-binding MarR family transcriptional regulator
MATYRKIVDLSFLADDGQSPWSGTVSRFTAVTRYTANLASLSCQFGCFCVQIVIAMARKSIENAAADFGHAVGLLVRRLRAAAASDELSWSETAVMARLAKDGPATTADLARAQGMKPQSMGTIVTTLEQLGMVERKPHPTDGRQVNIDLTTKGAAVQKRAGDAKRTWLAEAIAGLDEEERETLFAAGRIMERLTET